MNPALRDLSTQLKELQDREIAERSRPPVEERLAAVHAELGRRSVARSRAPLWTAGLTALAAAAAVMFLLTRPAAPLVATVAGRAVAAPEFVQSENAAETLSFSDGSAVRLEPHAALRVLSTRANGAALALERGKVRANVVHRSDTSWLLAAGPFEVHVTGTEFDARYDADSRELEVRMIEGSVRVTGACLEHPGVLSGTESGTFRCVDASSKSASSARPAAAPPPSQATTELSPAASTTAPTTPGSAHPSAAATLDGGNANDWRQLAGEGRFRAALAAAEALGFERLCNREDAASLLTLGNTARLAGNGMRAAEAYQALRRRFPGSASASGAAFQLGRLSFDGAANYAAAHQWFSAYLREAPGGGLAQEALGRVLECEHRLGRRDQAEATARRYLASYPQGAHASLAHSLLPQ